MSITPASYFNYDSTPFMQGLTSSNYSFEGQNQDNYGGFGLNRYKKGGSDSNNLFSVNTRVSSNPNRSLFASNRGAPTADVLGYEPTKSDVMPRNFKIQDAHDAIDAAVPALMPGDGGVGDATAIKQVNDVKENLTQIANSPNPDAMAQSLMSQPGYGSNSFGGGLMMMGLSIMSGADPLEAAKAGLQGQDYFDEKDRKAHTSDYLRQNARQLLDAGYSPDSISAAITNGDNSLLKMRQLSPEEKRQQALQDQQAENQEWDRRTAVSQSNAMQLKQTESADAEARARAAEARQAANEQAKETKATQQAEKDYTKNYLTGTNKFVQFNSRQNAYTSKAASWWEKYQADKQAGKLQEASKDLDFAAKELENSQIIGQRSTNPEEVQASQVSGGILDKLRTHIEQIKNGTIDPDAESALGNAIIGARDQEKSLIEDKAFNDYEAHRMQGLSPEQAAKLTNQFVMRVQERSINPKEYEEEFLRRQDPNYLPGSSLKNSSSNPRLKADQAPLGSANTSGKQKKKYNDANSKAAQALADQ